MWSEAKAREEIAELTDQLRSASSWQETRKMLLEHGYNPGEILLLAFMESEECLEWGLFLTSDDLVFEWEVDTNNGYQLNTITERIESEFSNYGNAVVVGKAILARSK